MSRQHHPTALSYWFREKDDCRTARTPYAGIGVALQKATIGAPAVGRRISLFGFCADLLFSVLVLLYQTIVTQSGVPLCTSTNGGCCEC